MSYLDWDSEFIRRTNLEIYMEQQQRFFLICPTRAAKDKMYRLCMSLALNSVTRPTVVFGIETEDEESDEWAADLRPEFDDALDIRTIRGDSGQMGPAHFWRLASLAIPKQKNDLVMLCADDLVFDTKGWDREFFKAYSAARDPWLYYCVDDDQNQNLATHPVVSAYTNELLGGLGSHHWPVANDSWMWNLFCLFDPPRVTYLPDVRIAHKRTGPNPFFQHRYEECRIDANQRGGELVATQMRRLVEAAELSDYPPRSVRREYQHGNFRFFNDGAWHVDWQRA